MTRTIAELRARCDTGAGGCWLWQGATDGRGIAVVWVSSGIAPALKGRGQPLLGPRAALLLAGRTIPPGHVAYNVCGDRLCCNPAHARAATKRAASERLVRSGVLRGDPKRAAINTQIMRQRAARTTGMSIEIARWVRESPQTTRELMHATGMSEYVILGIRRGSMWREHVAGASVFWR